MADLWNTGLLEAEFMEFRTIVGRFYGIKNYWWQILWKEGLIIAKINFR